MSLEQIGFIPVSPVPKAGDPNPNGWAGEYWPHCLRSKKYQAALEWFTRQAWDVKTNSEFWSLDCEGVAIIWCEALGVEFRPVHMGELPNAHQS